MKTIILFAALVLASIPLVAQPCLDLGLKGGFTSSELRPVRDWDNAGSNLSYHVGAFSRVGWGRLFIQPEAYFNSRGGELKEVFDENPANTVRNFDFTSVDIPVLAGLKLVKGDFINVRAMGGPVFGFITSGNVEPRPQPDLDYFRDHFYGWQYGVGVDLWFLTLDARIENTRNTFGQSRFFSLARIGYNLELNMVKGYCSSCR